MTGFGYCMLPSTHLLNKGSLVVFTCCNIQSIAKCVRNNIQKKNPEYPLADDNFKFWIFATFLPISQFTEMLAVNIPYRLSHAKDQGEAREHRIHIQEKLCGLPSLLKVSLKLI